MTRTTYSSFFFALLIASLLALTGCDASGVVGPEPTPTEDVVVTKNGDDDSSGGSVEPSDGHNTGCPIGDPEC